MTPTRVALLMDRLRLEAQAPPDEFAAHIQPYRARRSSGSVQRPSRSVTVPQR